MAAVDSIVCVCGGWLEFSYKSFSETGWELEVRHIMKDEEPISAFAPMNSLSDPTPYLATFLMARFARNMYDQGAPSRCVRFWIDMNKTLEAMMK